MHPRSKSLTSVSSVPFGPYRGAFRFLYLQAPEKTRRLCRLGHFDPYQLLAGEMVVSQDWHLQFWELFDSLPNDSFTSNAIAAGRLFMLEDLGDVGKVFQHAPNFGLAFQAWQNQDRLSDLLSCKIEPSELKTSTRRIEFHWKAVPLTESSFIYFCSFILFSLLGLGMNSAHFLRVSVPTQLISKSSVRVKQVLEAFRGEFRVPIRASTHKVFEIEISGEAFDQSTHLSDYSLFRFFESRLLHSDSVRSQSNSEWVTSVRLKLSSLLHDSQLQSKNIAQTLGISQRTFERRLKDAQTSFRDLKQEAQKQRALELLATGSSPKSVAQSVGFDDFSAFSRAFKKWTGKKPSELRISSIRKKGIK